MWRTLFVCMITGLLSAACSKNKAELVGRWRLVEILADPGDGSGRFHPVSSDKILEFYSDGIVKSNGRICNMSVSADSPSSAKYSLIDSTITSPDCTYLPFKITFKQIGDTLIVNYPCIEPCREKYKRE